MKDGFDALVANLLKGGFFLQEAVELLESTMIKGALLRAEGNQSNASKALGIHRNTLQKKMKAFDLKGSRTLRKPMARVTVKAARKRKSS